MTVVANDLAGTLAELDETDLARLDAWWHAANYLTTDAVAMAARELSADAGE